MYDQPIKQWDPKYAAIGVLVIVLSVLLLDVLPRMIRQRLGGEPSA